MYTTTGQEIRHSYDAGGNRFRKQVCSLSDGSITSDTYYAIDSAGKTEAVVQGVNGVNYTYNIWGNDMIGQVRMNGTTQNRFYYMKDPQRGVPHLGTIKMTVDAPANVVSYDDYYPYGMQMPTRSFSSSTEDTRY